MLKIFGPLDDVCRPVLVAGAEFVAPGENPVLYQEAANVLAGA